MGVGPGRCDAAGGRSLRVERARRQVFRGEGGVVGRVAEDPAQVEVLRHIHVGDTHREIGAEGHRPLLLVPAEQRRAVDLPLHRSLSGSTDFGAHHTHQGAREVDAELLQGELQVGWQDCHPDRLVHLHRNVFHGPRQAAGDGSAARLDQERLPDRGYRCPAWKAHDPRIRLAGVSVVAPRDPVHLRRLERPLDRRDGQVGLLGGPDVDERQTVACPTWSRDGDRLHAQDADRGGRDYLGRRPTHDRCGDSAEGDAGRLAEVLTEEGDRSPARVAGTAGRQRRQARQGDARPGDERKARRGRGRAAPACGGADPHGDGAGPVMRTFVGVSGPASGATFSITGRDTTGAAARVGAAAEAEAGVGAAEAGEPTPAMTRPSSTRTTTKGRATRDRTTNAIGEPLQGPAGRTIDRTGEGARAFARIHAQRGRVLEQAEPDKGGLQSFLARPMALIPAAGAGVEIARCPAAAACTAGGPAGPAKPAGPQRPTRRRRPGATGLTAGPRALDLRGRRGYRRGPRNKRADQRRHGAFDPVGFVGPLPHIRERRAFGEEPNLASCGRRRRMTSGSYVREGRESPATPRTVAR